MSDKSDRIFGIPNPSWALASVCLGIYACSWWFKGPPEEPTIHYLNFFHVVASIFGLLTAGVSFVLRVLWPIALMGALLSLPALIAVPMFFIIPAAFH